MGYRNKIYSKYISVHTAHICGNLGIKEISSQFQAWKSYFEIFLPKNKNAKIVDLGCGNGGFVYWLQHCGFINASGVDVSEEQILSAKKLGAKNIVQSDIVEFLKDKKGVFDVIFMRDVIEHFNKEEILKLLELAFQSLKKEGGVIIQTPNAESPFSGRYRYYDFTHEISFTEGSLRQVLFTSGFKKFQAYSMPPVIHGVKSFIRYVLWKCIECCLSFYLLVETGSSKGIFTQNIIVVAEKE